MKIFEICLPRGSSGKHCQTPAKETNLSSRNYDFITMLKLRSFHIAEGTLGKILKHFK